MLDKHNEINDRRLANHIVSLYGEEDLDMEIDSGKKSKSKKQTSPTIIRKEVLTTYISEARKNNPKLKDEIVDNLIKYYVDIRSSNGRNTISATPRQLESIIRLSEARARLRFSEFIENEDVEEAIRLIKVATQQAATDPITGLIDMDMIITGITSSSRAKLVDLIDCIKNVLREYAETARKGVRFSSLSDEVKKVVSGMEEFTFSDFEFRDALRLLEEENYISVI
jgi:DNA replication licensing factor MCM4